MKHRIFALTLALAAGAAQAGTSTGVVTAMVLRADGVNVVQLGGTLADHPPCGKASPGRFGIDANKVGGRQLSSVVEQAGMLRKTVVLKGAGACTVDKTVEDLASAEIDWR